MEQTRLKRKQKKSLEEEEMEFDELLKQQDQFFKASSKPAATIFDANKVKHKRELEQLTQQKSKVSKYSRESSTKTTRQNEDALPRIENLKIIGTFCYE